MRVLALLEAVGSWLLLQLGFVLVSLGVVTTASGAVALQRQLRDHAEGRPSGFLPLLQETRRTWRQSWGLGLLWVVVVAGSAVGVPFWLRVGGGLGVGAASALVVLLGALTALWLSTLAIADRARDEPWRVWVRLGAAQLAARPARALAATVLLLAWLWLLAFVPTLWLVGSGLVPALLVRYVLQDTDQRRAAPVVDPGVRAAQASCS